MSHGGGQNPAQREVMFMKRTRLVTLVPLLLAALCILYFISNQPKTVLVQGGWVAGSLHNSSGGGMAQYGAAELSSTSASSDLAGNDELEQLYQCPLRLELVVLRSEPPGERRLQCAPCRSADDHSAATRHRHNLDRQLNAVNDERLTAAIPVQPIRLHRRAQYWSVRAEHGRPERLRRPER